MSRLFNNMMVMAPEGDGGKSGAMTIEPGGLSKEDMINFLGDDDQDDKIELDPDKRTPKDKKPPKVDDDDEIHAEEGDDDKTDEDEDTDDELDEIEKELEGPSDEELEVVTPVRRREILKKYPTLFKDFPYLEKAYYREQQFTEIFPTIGDAKESHEKAQVLDMFEKDVINGGNTEKILAAVKSENPESFHRLVDQYLPTLAKVDQAAYHHVLGNVHKYTIHAMVREARQNKNEDLEKAAAILNQFVFGNTTYTPPTNLAKNKNPEQEQQQDTETKRQNEFVQTRFNTTMTDLNTRVGNTLRNTIDAHIDPKNSMSEYIKKNAIKDAQDSLNTAIRSDRRFTTLLDKLWEDAIKKNFNQESTDRIKSAYLSRARTLLPSVIKKARNEALRGMGKRVRDDSDSGESETSRNPTVKNEQPRSNKSGKIRSAKDIPHGMKTIDFLNSD